MLAGAGCKTPSAQFRIFPVSGVLRESRVLVTQGLLHDLCVNRRDNVLAGAGRKTPSAQFRIFPVGGVLRESRAGPRCCMGTSLALGVDRKGCKMKIMSFSARSLTTPDHRGHVLLGEKLDLSDTVRGCHVLLIKKLDTL